MSALRRAGTVLRSVYRLLFESQPLADLRGQAGHEMILRPRSRFANRNAKPWDSLTQALQADACERRVTLTTAVVDLVEQDLEAIAHETSVLELRSGPKNFC